MNREQELLLINLAEEAAEVQQMVAKCLRFGLYSCNPNDKSATMNWALLSKEVGNMLVIIDRLAYEEIIQDKALFDGRNEKIENLKKYGLGV